MTINYKKRIRLKNFDYKGGYRYFITLCTFNKKPAFEDNILVNPALPFRLRKGGVNWLIDVLREKSKSFGFKIWAYCFMPDHLHLLIEGKDSNSDMKQFISSYKQYTSYYHKKQTGLPVPLARQTGTPLWQINFYEHVLRNEEDTMNVVYYIFGNPVRKGLVGDYRKYKFLGSFEFDIKQT